MFSKGRNRSWNCLVDNTFKHEPFSNYQRRFCYDFAKQHEMDRLYHEFEVGNMKKLLRRHKDMSNDTNHYKPRYISGNSTYTHRPQTGIDVALGLNGVKQSSFHEVRSTRTPSTLQPLALEDNKLKFQGEPLEKWDQIKAEVEQRKVNEELKRLQFVKDMEDKKVEMESEKLREEHSRQLDKALVKDWAYQVDFKKRLEKDEKEKDVKKSIDFAKKLNLEEVSEKRNQLLNERLWQDIKREDLEKSNAKKSRDNLELFNQQQFEVVDGTKAKLEAKNDLEKEKVFEKQKAEATKGVQWQQIEENKFLKAQEKLDQKITETNQLTENQKVLDIKRDCDQISERNRLKQNQDFEEQRKQSIRQRQKEEHFSSHFIAEESRKILNDESDANAERIRGLKEKQFQNNEHLRKQMKERQDLEDSERKQKEQEKQNRLREETIYKNHIQYEKEKRSKEQQAYKQFLQAQINEIRQRNELETRNLAKFLEQEKVKMNAKDADENRRTRQMDVHRSQISFSYY